MNLFNPKPPMNNLNAYVTRDEAHQIIQTAYMLYQDRKLQQAFPETYGLLFETLWATGVRISEAVGGDGYDTLVCRNRAINHRYLRQEYSRDKTLLSGFVLLVKNIINR